MPPKRKARVPSRAPSTPSAAGDHAASATPSSAKASPAKRPIESDAWTDEQETSLLKGAVRWKPAGMHKHYRMIAISENMRNHGFTGPEDDHTRPPGAWKKLAQWYNLEALDEIEDGFGYAPWSDPAQEVFCDFALPDEEYFDKMFAKRLAKEPPSSPPLFTFQLSGAEFAQAGRRYSTVENSEEPRSSPASTKGQRGGRGGRGKGPSKLAESSRPGRRGRASKESVEPSAGEEDNEDSASIDEDAGKTRRSGRKK